MLNWNGMTVEYLYEKYQGDTILTLCSLIGADGVCKCSDEVIFYNKEIVTEYYGHYLFADEPVRNLSVADYLYLISAIEVLYAEYEDYMANCADNTYGY